MCDAISGLGTLWGVMLDFAPAAENTIISSIRPPPTSDKSPIREGVTAQCSEVI